MLIYTWHLHDLQGKMLTATAFLVLRVNIYFLGPNEIHFQYFSSMETLLKDFKILSTVKKKKTNRLCSFRYVLSPALVDIKTVAPRTTAAPFETKKKVISRWYA